jgi:hypothetical protein
MGRLSTLLAELPNQETVNEEDLLPSKKDDDKFPDGQRF